MYHHKLALPSTINPPAQKLTNLVHDSLPLWGVCTAGCHLMAHLLRCLSAKKKKKRINSLAFPHPAMDQRAGGDHCHTAKCLDASSQISSFVFKRSEAKLGILIFNFPMGIT